MKILNEGNHIENYKEVENMGMMKKGHSLEAENEKLKKKENLLKRESVRDLVNLITHEKSIENFVKLRNE